MDKAMDYILFHSQYSPSSKKILEEYPSILEKAVSVDSQGMRKYVKRLHIVCVPTLIVLLNNKIIDRIVGYDAISNWIMVTLYRANQLSYSTSSTSSTSAETMMGEEPSNMHPEMGIQHAVAKESDFINPSNLTNLDDLVLIDESPTPSNQGIDNERMEPKIQMGGSNTMALAEALKKERDGSLENKKRMI
jgi:hypothetical protein